VKNKIPDGVARERIGATATSFGRATMANRSKIGPVFARAVDSKRHAVMVVEHE
jgi:hypothetical protein